MAQVSYDSIKPLIARIRAVTQDTPEDEIIASCCAVPFLIQNPWATDEQLMEGISEVSTYIALLINDQFKALTPTPKSKVN